MENINDICVALLKQYLYNNNFPGTFKKLRAELMQ